MPDARVDYNRIAPSYDQRYVTNSLQEISDALAALVVDLSAERVLEVGCGTGRWLADLEPVAHQLCGLDLSFGMLRQAVEGHARLHVMRGQAGHLPLSDGAFDLVYCVQALHHFDDQEAFIAQARRLLRPGGALAVVGMDPHTSRPEWYVYDYFLGTLETDLRRFPSWGTVMNWMVADGFTHVVWKRAARIVDHKMGRDVLHSPFLRKDACSQLTLLTNEAYADGLRRIKEALTQGGTRGESLTFTTDIELGMLVGRTSEKEANP